VIVHAVQSLRAEFAFSQRGQQQSGENADDGNDNQQFDEGESASAPPAVKPQERNVLLCPFIARGQYSGLVLKFNHGMQQWCVFGAVNL
jgi:hypothetical protein